MTTHLAPLPFAGLCARVHAFANLVRPGWCCVSSVLNMLQQGEEEHKRMCDEIADPGAKMDKWGFRLFVAAPSHTLPCNSRGNICQRCGDAGSIFRTPLAVW